MMLLAPPHSDGPQSMTIRDSVTGASTTMTNVLTYGADASDNLVLIYTGNPQTPVGTQSAKPVTVRVVAADTVTPIEGATVGWTTTSSLQLSACGGATSCSRITDQDGYVTTWLTPVTAGASTVTATLAPGDRECNPVSLGYQCLDPECLGLAGCNNNSPAHSPGSQQWCAAHWRADKVRRDDRRR
jgi:hypothetical protein